MKYLKHFEELNNTNNIEKILSDCAPFIKQLKKCNNNELLYHSTKSGDIKTNIEKGGIYKLTPRVREKPRDMPIVLHEYLGDNLVEKFGWNPRTEAIFAHTDNFKNAHYYGLKYMIFPIGEYKYVWNTKISDPYLTLWTKYEIMQSGIECIYTDSYIPKKEDLEKLIIELEKSSDIDLDLEEPDSKQKLINELTWIYEDLDNYLDSCIDNNICDLLNSNNEIMLKADGYYIVSIDMEYDIKKIIFG